MHRRSALAGAGNGLWQAHRDAAVYSDLIADCSARPRHDRLGSYGGAGVSPVVLGEAVGGVRTKDCRHFASIRGRTPRWSICPRWRSSPVRCGGCCSATRRRDLAVLDPLRSGAGREAVDCWPVGCHGRIHIGWAKRRLSRADIGLHRGHGYAVKIMCSMFADSLRRVRCAVDPKGRGHAAARPARPWSSWLLRIQQQLVLGWRSGKTGRNQASVFGAVTFWLMSRAPRSPERVRANHDGAQPCCGTARGEPR